MVLQKLMHGKEREAPEKKKGTSPKVPQTPSLGAVHVERRGSSLCCRRLGNRTVRSLIVLPLFIVELSLFIRRGILVLLVLRNEVVHVRLRLGELHFVHA